MPTLTARLNQGLAYWNRLRGARAMPSRADVDPLDLRGLLPYVYLLDVEGPSRYRYRLIGQDIIDNLKNNATGRIVDDSLFGEGTQEILAMYDHVAAQGEPVINRGRAFWVDNFWRRYTSLILPLSGDGRRVDKMLAVMEFETLRGLPADFRPEQFARWRPLGLRLVVASDSEVT